MGEMKRRCLFPTRRFTGLGVWTCTAVQPMAHHIIMTDARLPSAIPDPLNTENYDAVVIGGGPIGGMTACALALTGMSVAVIETREPADLVRPGTDGRSIALALSSQRVLAGTGIWPLLSSEAEPIQEIRITDGHAPVFLHYDHNAVGTDPFGWIVENTTIRRAIHDRLKELANVHLFAPHAVIQLERAATHVTALLDDGTAIRADLAIGADGRSSSTRKQAGIAIRKAEYGQAGIVTTVAHEKPHRGIAHERFLSSGPFAILPMTGNRSSIVWGEKAHLAPVIVAQDDAGFLAELRWRFGDFLGEVTLAGPRFFYPLTLQLAERAIDRRLVLIGDAAHGMHPVAGQGMNMGIRDVAALAEVLVDARRLGQDLGSPDILERYQRWRRFDNLLMLGMTDGLVRLFSNDIGPLRLARTLGLAAVHAMPDTKRFFMRHAMGLVGNLPRLIRGVPL